MAAQLNYNYASAKGIPGGIYDMYHYPVDTRFNEEANGKLRFGVGVVRGTLAGSNIKLPTENSTADDFEGVSVNGFSNQHDLDGKVFILNNQNIGVMKKGRIWAVLAKDEAPSYGDEVHLIISGEDAGTFATTGGIKLAGRFLGGGDNGVAPIELDGGAATETAPAPAAKPVSMSDITDVDLETPATDGQVLKYSAADSKWKPADDSVSA